MFNISKNISCARLYANFREVPMADTIIAIKENSKTVSYFLDFFFLPDIAYMRVLALYYI